jgi:hypothetical protein
MARPQVADGGECLQIWKVAANILVKLLDSDEDGWSFSLMIGQTADNNVSP